jgi:hypothetical protein
VSIRFAFQNQHVGPRLPAYDIITAGAEREGAPPVSDADCAQKMQAASPGDWRLVAGGKATVIAVIKFPPRFPHQVMRHHRGIGRVRRFSR